MHTRKGRKREGETANPKQELGRLFYFTLLSKAVGRKKRREKKGRRT